MAFSLALRSQRQIDEFRQVVEDCGFYEFSFTGFEFTWDNRREGDANVKERIDRGFGNFNLIQKCGGFVAHHLVTMSSDHCPILIEAEPPSCSDSSFRRRGCRFLFEEMWTKEEECGQLINQVWEEGRHRGVNLKIKAVAEKLKIWEKEKFGQIRRSVDELRKELDSLQRAFPSGEVMQQRREVELKLDKLLETEEIMWCQRARNLFTSNGGQFTDELFQVVDARVTVGQSVFLNSSFTRGEVESALKQMGATKSPGPDGMPPIFYQKYWDVVGPDVVLANRLKKVLPTVISEFQSAFVPNRSIHDNVIAAFEIIHNLKRRGKKSRQKVAVKLDMAKAYDRVEWNFLRRMMEGLGFPGRFVELVMSSVQSVNYSIVLQGKPFGKVKPTRRIRQGDPISPYLFLMVAEGFSSLLWKAVSEGQLHGIAIARGAPCLSHLFFTYDSLLFCDTSAGDCSKLKEIIERYEMASRQKISTEKSAVCFSPKTNRATKEECCAILDMKVVPCQEKYLGLPTVTGRNKKGTFRGLADQVWKRVQGWDGKILSKGGKEILIKVVAQSIPFYTMSVFQLPIGTCEEITKHIARFWWGKPNGRGIHWKSWDKLCWSKNERDLGFREIQQFNKALVAKQGWRLLRGAESLVGRMLKA
ncbi:uncharacterized protein LOC112177323 [Rosa chinensis]|uniref:uncharacterized protein LOC112177323 n=1 Tax=Rosa chinensis TaxID=74649 RepID=UPI000D08933C|nr:uncharacterized protein LOC112177323 [Rosa chinensis]